jgi:pilus assembly protein CpaE
MSQPQVIVSAMRAGAREFIERPTTTTDLLEAFVRLTTAHRKVQRDTARGRVFTVVNAKGGCGATTIAVNLALALQSAHGNTALVDIAPLGHAALHLNLKPLFSVADAIRNLHRLDSSLLESFMIRHGDGLMLLAGSSTPLAIDPSTAEFARLFDMLVGHFRYVVVDASTRSDSTTRLVSNLSEAVLLIAHADVASLWSAARVQQYLSDAGGGDRIQLVLNRFRKIPGFSEADAEAAAGVKLAWKIPNQYFAVSAAIDRGIPVMQQSHTEIARSFTGLAAQLTAHHEEVKRTAWSLFKTV